MAKVTEDGQLRTTTRSTLGAVFVGTMVLTWALVMVGDSGLLAGHRPAGIAAH